jgi:antitoxin component of MazEF toxin-antitoxin module
LTKEGKVAKKFALYPPKGIIEQLGLKEGQRVRYEVEGGKLVVGLLPDPTDLALTSKKWTRTSTRELERPSDKEQSELDA